MWVSWFILLFLVLWQFLLQRWFNQDFARMAELVESSHDGWQTAIDQRNELLREIRAYDAKMAREYHPTMKPFTKPYSGMAKCKSIKLPLE